MPIVFQCGGCRTMMQAAEQHAGQSVRCPQCGSVLPIPYPAAIPVAAPAPIPQPAAAPVEDDIVDADLDDIVDADLDDIAPRKKKKRRKKRRRAESTVRETLYYWLGGLGIFPFVLLGLVAMWIVLWIASVKNHGAALWLVWLGSGVYGVGWIWLITVSFRDDAFSGMMCLTTHVYWLVYVYMNFSEAWRPATIMLLGAMMSGWGALLFFLVYGHRLGLAV